MKTRNSILFAAALHLAAEQYLVSCQSILGNLDDLLRDSDGQPPQYIVDDVAEIGEYVDEPAENEDE